MTRSACLVLTLGLLAGCGPDKPGGVTIDQDPDTRDLPFEPLDTHPRAELSNLRFGRWDTGQERYTVDWKWTRKADAGQGLTLVIRPRGRPPKTVQVSMSKTGGTITGEYISDGSGVGGKGVLESGCEMYLVVGGRTAFYKVSNSVTSGGVAPTGTRPAPTP